MKNIKVIDSADVKDIVLNELRQKGKLISKEAVKSFVQIQVVKQNKKVYSELDRLRSRIIDLELKE